MRIALLATALALTAGAASAQAVGGLSFDAGAGLRYGPDYVGSDEGSASPWLILRNLGFADAPAGAPADGFHIAPSANYVKARKSEDHDALQGLDDVDASIELGLKAGYRVGPVDAYGAIRKGVTGHEGVVGEVGLTHRAPVTERVTLNSGIEAQYGDARYMDSYFGVSPAESAASGYPAAGGYPVFDPKGGIRSVSASVEMRYQATDNVAVLGQLRAGRLVGDAADSPVTKNRNQVSVGVGVVRHFSFRF